VIISLKKLGIKEYKDFENLEKKFEQERRDMIIDIEEYKQKSDEEIVKCMKEEIEKMKYYYQLGMIAVLTEKMNSKDTNDKEKEMCKGVIEYFKEMIKQEENKGKKQDEKEEKEDKNVEEDEKEEKEGKNVEEDEKEGKGMGKPENNNYCNDQIININNDDDN
jgi:hypothetical protein